MTRMLGVPVFVLAMVLPASADMFLTVTATAGNQTSIREFRIPHNESGADWTLPESVAMMAGDVQLATITDLSIESDVDPYIKLRFEVEAGASNTTFTIKPDPPAVSFAALTNPHAYASAGITLTSDSNGAFLTGQFPGGKSYEARYNGASLFSDLVAGFTIPGDDTVAHSGRSPASGYTTIAGSVTSIESEFKFILSAGDQASGTSRFEVMPNPVPEPATLGLMVLGGAALLVRRRR